MRKIYSLLFLTSLAFSAGAQSKLFSMQQAVAFALANNVAAKNAVLDEKKMKYQAWEIKTMGMPKIDATIDFNYYYKVPQAPAFTKSFGDTNSISIKSTKYLAQYMAATGDFRLVNDLQSAAQNSKPFTFVLPFQATASATLTQLIFDERYIVGLKAVKDLKLSSTYLRQRTDVDVEFAVRKAYIQAAAGQESEASLRNVKEIVDKTLSDLRATYKEGLIEELDVNRMELVQTNLESQIQYQDQLAALALANLKFQMGLPMSDAITLTDKLKTLQAKMPREAEIKFDPAKRVEYQLLELGVKLKGYDMAQKRAGYYPTLLGFLNFGYNAQVSEGKYLFKNEQFQGQTLRSWNPQGLVGLKLAIPIFDSGQKWASIKQAKMEQEKATNDFENFKQAAALQVELARVNYNALIQEELNTTRSLELSEKIFRKSNIKYKEGVGSSFELTQAQQEMVQNKLKYVQTVMNLLINRTELDKALGTK